MNEITCFNHRYSNPSLSVLPVENLSSIFNYLTNSELRSARLVCRNWNDHILTIKSDNEMRSLMFLVRFLIANLDQKEHAEIVAKLFSLMGSSSILEMANPSKLKEFLYPILIDLDLEPFVLGFQDNPFIYSFLSYVQIKQDETRNLKALSPNPIGLFNHGSRLLNAGYLNEAVQFVENCQDESVREVLLRQIMDYFCSRRAFPQALEIAKLPAISAKQFPYEKEILEHIVNSQLASAKERIKDLAKTDLKNLCHPAKYLATAYLMQGDWQSAIECTTVSGMFLVTQDTEDWLDEIHHSSRDLGRHIARQGYFHETMAYAVESNLGGNLFVCGLCDAQLDEGKLDDVLQNIDNIYTLYAAPVDLLDPPNYNPDVHKIIQRLSLAYIQKGDLDKALHAAEKLQKDKKRIKLLVQIYTEYVCRRKDEEALSLENKIASEFDLPLLHACFALAKEGKLDEIPRMVCNMPLKKQIVFINAVITFLERNHLPRDSENLADLFPFFNCLYQHIAELRNLPSNAPPINKLISQEELENAKVCILLFQNNQSSSLLPYLIRAYMAKGRTFEAAKLIPFMTAPVFPCRHVSLTEELIKQKNRIQISLINQILRMRKFEELPDLLSLLEKSEKRSIIKKVVRSLVQKQEILRAVEILRSHRSSRQALTILDKCTPQKRSLLLDEFISQFTREGKTSFAEAFIEKVLDDSKRDSYYESVVRQMAAKNGFIDAIKVSKKIINSEQKKKVLLLILVESATKGYNVPATKIAKLYSKLYGDKSLMDLWSVILLARAGGLSTINQLIEKKKVLESSWRNIILPAIALSMARGGHFENAEVFANSLTGEEKIQALQYIKSVLET